MKVGIYEELTPPLQCVCPFLKVQLLKGTHLHLIRCNFRQLAFNFVEKLLNSKKKGQKRNLVYTKVK